MSTQLEFSGVPLLEWCRAAGSWPDDGMIYKNATVDQVCFVRDKLPCAFVQGRDEYSRHQSGNDTVVIGTHRSKSCVLPVYGLDIKSLGVKAVMRNNFYNWAVSITMPRPVDLSMFKAQGVRFGAPVNAVYCEGFEDRWVLGSYAQDQCAFTIELNNNYALYALFMMIAHQLRQRREHDREGT
jgi:hypothetical protein